MLSTDPKNYRHIANSAFTLVELLVVIGISVVLISLFLPALRLAWQEARDIQCASQQRQIGLAIVMYVGENHGYLPYNDLYANVMYRGAAAMVDHSFPDHYTGLGKLFELDYLKTPAILWCSNELSSSGLRGGPDANGHGIATLIKPVAGAVVENDYWYRCGTGDAFSSPQNWPGNPSEQLQNVKYPDDGLLMCGGQPIQGSTATYIVWPSIHQARGINILFSDGRVEWFSYTLHPNFPDTSVGQNGQTGTPAGSGGNRYRADYSNLTIKRATAVQYGTWKYP